jgi:transglutaminase-like putative cysteine protease
MMLAPQPQLSGQVVIIKDGYPGIEQTIRAMRKLVQQYRTDIGIRQAASQAVFLTPQKNDYAEIEAVFHLVQQGIRYCKDIHQVETLSTPTMTLAQRLGDCDDQATLLATLLESIGYPTRFVIAAYQQPGMYEHVYIQVYCHGQWLDLDPTEQQGIGWSPPGAVSIAVEQV